MTSSSRESLLPQALEALTLYQVARACNVEIRQGVQNSPFREDKKQSFSVQRNGTGWKDFASGEGGSIWKFAKLCMPSAPDGEIARFLIGLAGLDPETPAGAARAPGPVRRAASRPEKKFRHAKPWADLVRRRWTAGVEGIDAGATGRLAERRGWPESFVQRLVALDALAYPPLPWHDEMDEGARRAWAFKVERLRLREGALDAAAVGFHQTFEIFDAEAQKARKSFVYVPYEPQEEKKRSTFQRFLRGTVPPYPFFLGGLRPGVVVITEGQWDAATFFCAAAPGVFAPASAAALPFAVLGLRGAQSLDAAMECLGPYLGAARPAVWLWPDNDAAGSTWVRNEPGKEACFQDRLLAAGASRVVRSTTRGKDLNDDFRAEKFGRADILRWACAVGLGPYFPEWGAR